MNVLDKLRGGDLRSIGRSNEVAGDIEIIKVQKATGSSALQSRGRKLLQRLERKQTNV